MPVLKSDRNPRQIGQNLDHDPLQRKHNALWGGHLHSVQTRASNKLQHPTGVARLKIYETTHVRSSLRLGLTTAPRR